MVDIGECVANLHAEDNIIVCLEVNDAAPQALDRIVGSVDGGKQSFFSRVVIERPYADHIRCNLLETGHKGCVLLYSYFFWIHIGSTPCVHLSRTLHRLYSTLLSSTTTV